MSSSTSGSTNLYQVDKLTNSNFSTWKFRIEMVLKARKLWKYVETEADASVKEKEQEQEALSQIALTVSDGVIGHIRNAKTARQAWLKICSVFEQKGLASQVFLRRKLINVKLEDSEPMQNHINKIRELSDQLEAIGDPVKDRELAIIILCSLPERYNSLVISLESRSPKDLTFDMVAGRLLAEEERQKESESGSNSGESAFYSGRFPRKKSPLKSPLRCNFCGRVGHMERNCYDKHGHHNADDKDDKKRSNDSALSVVSQVSDELMLF
jgi:gag-polypeptide of LTR copia-type/Domain of unknown function (DUF4219)